MAENGFVIAWTSVGQDSSNTGVYAKRYDLNGYELTLPTSGINGAVGNEFRINSYTSDSQYYPKIIGLAEGDFIIVWVSTHQDGSASGIFGKRFLSNGTEISIPSSGINTAVGNEFAVNSFTNGNQDLPSISSLKDGGFVIVWHSDSQNANGDIIGKRYSVKGSEIALPTSGQNGAVGNEFVVNSVTISTYVQEFPAIGSLTDGGFLITWDSLFQNDGKDIFGKRYLVNGTETQMPMSGKDNADGNEFPVNLFTFDYQQRSSIKALLNGNFVIVWSSSIQSNFSGIFARSFALDGTTVIAATSGLYSAVGSEFMVSSYTTISYHREWPKITALNDAGFVVVWESSNQDTSSGGIFGKRFNADGSEYTVFSSGLNNAIDNEFAVNQRFSGEQGHPDVCSLIDGGYIIVWESGSDQDGSSDGIYGMRYDNDGNRIPLLIPNYTKSTEASTSTSITTSSGVLSSSTTPEMSSTKRNYSSVKDDGDDDFNPTAIIITTTIGGCLVVSGAIGFGIFAKRYRDQQNSQTTQQNDLSMRRMSGLYQ